MKSPKELDKETKKVLTEGDSLKSMVEGRGWAIARERLLKKVAECLNIADIGLDNPQNLALLIGIRQEVAKTLIEWMKDIEGTASQHVSNNAYFEEVKDRYIVHY